MRKQRHGGGGGRRRRRSRSGRRARRRRRRERQHWRVRGGGCVTWLEPTGPGGGRAPPPCQTLAAALSPPPAMDSWDGRPLHGKLCPLPCLPRHGLMGRATPPWQTVAAALSPPPWTHGTGAPSCHFAPSRTPRAIALREPSCNPCIPLHTRPEDIRRGRRGGPEGDGALGCLGGLPSLWL